MYFVKPLVLSAILITAFTGCQSQQAKVDALQKEYDQLEPAICQRLFGGVFEGSTNTKPKVCRRKQEAWRSVEAASGGTRKAIIIRRIHQA